MTFQRMALLAAAGLFGIALGGVPDDASALLISNPTISPGISKNFQTNPPGDLSSSAGYKVELTLKFEFGADAVKCGTFATPVACSATTGRVTATLKNVSDVTGDNKSNITAFGLSLLGNQAHGKNDKAVPASGLFQSVLGFNFDGIGCVIDGCTFHDATSADGDSPSEIKNFLGDGDDIDLGSDRNSGSVNVRGISATSSAQETGVFSWLVAGDFASLCSDGTCTTLAVDGSTWASLIDPQLVDNCEGAGCVDFNAFWGVHMQSLPAGSDKLGGAVLVDVPPPPPPGIPEPLTAGLIGLGLVGMGAMRWKLQAA